MKPHKFKYGANNSSVYGQVVFCEYCGMVVFNANYPEKYESSYPKSKEGCPCSPDKPEKLNEPL